MWVWSAATVQPIELPSRASGTTWQETTGIIRPLFEHGELWTRHLCETCFIIIPVLYVHVRRLCDVPFRQYVGIWTRCCILVCLSTAPTRGFFLCVCVCVCESKWSLSRIGKDFRFSQRWLWRLLSSGCDALNLVREVLLFWRHVIAVHEVRSVMLGREEGA